MISVSENLQEQLYYAALAGDVGAIEALVKRGADLHSCEFGESAVQGTFEGRHLRCFQYLEERGVDFSDVSAYLKLAASADWLEIAALFLRRGGQVQWYDQHGKSGLYWAALGGHLEVVRLLLTHGGIPDQAQADGETPLHAAAREGHVDVLTVLLESGGDSNLTLRDDGFAPLHQAAYSSDSRLAVRVLCAHGADVLIRDSDDMTPLHYAAQAGHASSADELLQLGADVNATDDHDNSPLNVAALFGHVAAVQLLLNAGSQVNWANRHGWSPLHHGIGQPEIVDLLIRAGADVTARDAEGNTALHLLADAKVPNASESAGILLAAGAPRDSINRAGQTAAQVAREARNVQLAEVFEGH